MNKAILVIDMPNDCLECNFCVEMAAQDRCVAVGKRIFTIKKPDWCPLKPLPEYCINFGGDDDYADGYNDCLHEIVGRN